MRLNTDGSLEDLGKLSQVEPDLVVTAHDDEVGVDAGLERDRLVWVGVMVSDFRGATAKKDGSRRLVLPYEDFPGLSPKLGTLFP